MDRAQPGVSWSQAGLITVVALPMAHAWATLLPATGPLLYAAASNRAQWEGEATALRARARADEAAAEATAAAAAAAAGAAGAAAAARAGSAGAA
jgi:hypothetical protein